jgi:hypothetical protein
MAVPMAVALAVLLALIEVRILDSITQIGPTDLVRGFP